MGYSEAWGTGSWKKPEGETSWYCPFQSLILPIHGGNLDVCHPLHDLSEGIITSDIGKALEFSQKVEAGTVWVNCYNQVCCQAGSFF
jgi:hypothetical protein